ncbi:MAG: hypothetical protein E7678_02525 [Ruminococcaceae bacterium]|nr:hypothetical protein [Oscillospiraceae bacterium]
MKNSKKITLIIIYVLVCSILLATVFFLNSLAKFVTTDASSDGARVAKWGMEITTGSNLSNTYSKSNSGEAISLTTATSSDGDKIIMPGTSGSFAWFNISGTPEAAYNVDIQCEKIKDDDTMEDLAFSVGEGFSSADRLIRDERGLAVEYFPLVITLHIYDIGEGGAKTDVGTPMSFAIKKTGAADNATVMCDDLSDLVTRVNASLDTYFDSEEASIDAINRVYSVEWSWPYLPASEAFDETEKRIVKIDGVVTYQSSYLDTALCEAVYANRDNDLFKIKLDLRATVTQAN